MSWTRRLCWAWLCCVVGCAHARQPHESNEPPATEAQQLYRQGVALANEGDLTRAEEYFATAHRTGGRDRESLVALLAVCVRASRLRSALAYAEPYLHEHPREVPLLWVVSSVQLGLGQLDAAERTLEQALACDEARPESHYLLARVLSTRALAAHARGEKLSRGRQARRHFARYLVLAPHGLHVQEAEAALGS